MIPNTNQVSVEPPTMLKVKKLSEFAVIPTKSTKFSVGFDLVAAHDAVIAPRGKSLVKTDIAMAIPHGCYGRIAPRSGLSWKHHIDIGAGVIDGDYRGNVGVVMFNLAETEFKVDRGMRIAQLILERYESTAELKEVEDSKDTERGDGGYGSTGLQANKQSENENEKEEKGKDGEAKNVEDNKNSTETAETTAVDENENKKEE